MSFSVGVFNFPRLFFQYQLPQLLLFFSLSVFIDVILFMFNFLQLDSDASLASSIINIQIIVYLMMVFNIHMVAPFLSAFLRFCKYHRYLLIVAFLTSLEYPFVFRIASNKFLGVTSFLQYHECCSSDVCSVKCLRHLVQKCFFIDFLFNRF